MDTQAHSVAGISVAIGVRSAKLADGNPDMANDLSSDPMRSIILLAAWLAIPSFADAAPVACPAQYSVPSARIAAAEGTPPGWRALLHANLSLRGAGVIEGPPEKNGELVPEIRKKGGLVEVVFQNLDASPTLEKWASCGYGEGVGIDVTLIRRLPQGVKRCVVRYRQQPGKRPDRFDGFDCE